jgi:hypothetical protein
MSRSFGGAPSSSYQNHPDFYNHDKIASMKYRDDFYKSGVIHRINQINKVLREINDYTNGKEYMKDEIQEQISRYMNAVVICDITINFLRNESKVVRSESTDQSLLNLAMSDLWENTDRFNSNLNNWGTSEGVPEIAKDIKKLYRNSYDILFKLIEKKRSRYTSQICDCERCGLTIIR